MKPSLHLPPPAARRRLIPVAVVLLLAMILAVVWIRRSSGTRSDTTFHEVRRGTFTVSIVEAGNLAAVSEISIRNEVEGTARIIYIAPEGSFVRKGDLLVELDSASAQDQVNQQQINFEKAQFALIQAQQQLAIQQSAVDSDIQAAELDVRLAKLALAKYEQGQRLVSLIEASNKLVQAEAQLAVNAETYTWTTNLASKGYETKQKVDGDRLAVLNNQNNVIVFSNQIWMLQEFDIPKELETLKAQVSQAEKGLERVLAQSKAKLAQANADLLTQSNTLSLNLRKLERDRKNLEATKIHAPQDGLVVYAVGENRFSSESLVEEGATVRNRQELIKLPDTSRMKVTVKVHESHVNNIRAGLPSYVILDSMPDARFEGYVERVALLPDTQARWGNPNLKVYNTEVFITDPLPDVKPGVSAKAEIIITNIFDALSVPIQAVTTLKGKQVVYALDGGKPVPKPVEVGMYNTKFIQIISGIGEGDRVLLAPPFDTQDRDLDGAVLTAEEKAAVTNRPARIPRNGDRNGNGSGPDSTSTTNTSRAPSMAIADGPAAPRAGMDAAGAGGPGAPGGANGAPGGAGREEMLKQFDKDGDGQLDEAEREALRTAMAARFGGGQRMNREEMMKRFDTDGDGQLSEEERAAMRQATGGGRGGGGGDRPRGNREGGGGGGNAGPAGSQETPRSP